MYVFAYFDNTLDSVYDAEGSLDPEEWARTHGVRDFPDAIYFFVTLTT